MLKQRNGSGPPDTGGVGRGGVREQRGEERNRGSLINLLNKGRSEEKKKRRKKKKGTGFEGEKSKGKRENRSGRTKRSEQRGFYVVTRLLETSTL